MISPNSLFQTTNKTYTPLFNNIKLVWDSLDRIKLFTTELIIKDGLTGKLLRRQENIIPRTLIIYKKIIYEQDFKIIKNEHSKNRPRVFLNNSEINNATIIYAGAIFIDDLIHIEPGVIIEPGVYIKGPTYIGKNSEIRQGAYLRGGCLIGQNCIIGHSTEIKNSVMLDGSKASHFSYLGDSILGYEVNLGAGTKLANLKIINNSYSIKIEKTSYIITRRKFGAIIGDNVAIGCNSVTNPGTIIGKQTLVGPCLLVPSGFYPAYTIIR